MPAVQRVVKPKTNRGKRFLESRSPQINEGTKSVLFIKGKKTSDLCAKALKDFSTLKKPHVVVYTKKNDIKPMEDATSLEFFAEKSGTPLFVFASHNKKRPHNLVIGRTYDNHILDMIELGVEDYKSLTDFKVSKVASGTKPALIFSGEPFEVEAEFKRLKNLFIDFFRGPVVEAVRLAGLEHVLSFTAIDGKIILRSYKILLKKSGCKTPRIELEEIGPSADFIIRRTKIASDDLYKLSLKQPKQLKVKKTKNVEKNTLGTRLGRIHMQKQDLNRLQTKKMKGLKKVRPEKKRKIVNRSDNPRSVKSVKAS